MNFSRLFSKIVETKSDTFFENVVGHDNIKRLFGMALQSEEPVHILLSGPPASAKTMFLQSLMTKLSNSYFVDGSNTTKSGMIDYLFENTPKYLLIDEIDKMPARDQTFLLNLMETGIVTETKHKKTRTANMKTWIFATSNNTEKIMAPLQSRFFVVKLEPYTYEQFYQITVQLLTQQHKVKSEIAKAAAEAVWNNNKMRSGNIRDCVKIGRMAKSVQDVNFIVDTFPMI
jgi:Holliday junction resolvasome RuvABC ATP-dependent DNA helicase subunit